MKNNNPKKDRNNTKMIIAKYTSEAKKKIQQNTDVYERNEKQIPRLEEEFEMGKTFFDTQIKLTQLKLDSQMRVLQPSWDFEQTQEFSDLNRKLVELELRKQKNQQEEFEKKTSENIETLKEQQERIIIENKSLENKLERLKNGEIVPLDEE